MEICEENFELKEIFNIQIHFISTLNADLFKAIFDYVSDWLFMSNAYFF